jgi:Fe-S cluster biosynthesis and repair protein YggX
MHKDGSTSVGRTFVLVSTDNQDITGKYTCISPLALALWLESQNEMLTESSVSWSRVARLAWSGKAVYLVLFTNCSASYLLVPEESLACYRQDGRRLVQSELQAFTFEDFMEGRAEELAS